ncbi:MAG TPA: Bax inhibitor-1/YccA family protein [Microlunatus sp.]
MLRSSNPVLSRKDAFTPAAPQHGQDQYQQGQFGPQYGQPFPAEQGYGQPPYGPQYGQTTEPAEGRMTFDDVVTKTVITMAVLVAAAVASWWGLSSGVIPAAFLWPAMIVSAIVGFITVIAVAARRKVNPGLVLVYAAVEGVFIGLLSLIFEMRFPGIVMQAVIGTFAAAGVTLAAYKIFNIRVTPKFRKIVILATIGFAAAMLINLVFALFGLNLGLRGVGGFSVIALLFSAIGVTLAVLNLVLDFDYIEQGVAMGAPASESWRGAFGLTVTMVWLYVEILRILSYLRR